LSLVGQIAERMTPLRGEWYGYVVLAAGFLVHMCLGTIYTWGNLTTYLTSYMRRRDPSITYSDTVWVYFVTPAALSWFLFLTAPIQGWLGPRLSSLAGSLLLGGGVMVSSYVVSHSLPALIVTYGLIFGLASGVIYTCPMNIALQYIPHRRGLITGVVIGGYGIGAFVFNFFITGYVNPHDCKPVCPAGGDYTGYTCPGWAPNSTSMLGGDDCDNNEHKYFPPSSSVAGQVPDVLFILGCVYTALTVIGSLFLVAPDEPFFGGLVQPQFLRRRACDVEGENDDNYSSVGGEGSEVGLGRGGEALLPDGNELSTREVIRSRLGWQMALGFMGTGIGGLFVMGNYKSYGQDRDWSTDHFEQQLSSFMSIANALGRLLTGTAADYSDSPRFW